MLFNYIKVAVRNITKYKVFSFINIAGMAISLASFMLIALYVTDELAYDRHHPDGDRTYRVYNVRDIDGSASYLPIVPYPFASFMKKDFPEIESTLRMMDSYGDRLFDNGDKKILESNGMFAESTVFNMLSLKPLSSNADASLDQPNTIALCESLAKKYFGEVDPIGKAIKINYNDYEVTAVYADPPVHFHLKLNYVMSFITLGWQNSHENNWQQHQIFTYLKLRPGTDAIALEEKFKPFIEKYAYPLTKPNGVTYLPHLQNIKDIHLYSSNFQWEIAQRGSAESIYILAGTAVLIMVIASLNFINLSTARSMKRMKEVGVRKVVGADRSKLVLQFI
jgi:putative ABC transport system permease protein